MAIFIGLSVLFGVFGATYWLMRDSQRRFYRRDELPSEHYGGEDGSP